MDRGNNKGLIWTIVAIIVVVVIGWIIWAWVDNNGDNGVIENGQDATQEVNPQEVDPNVDVDAPEQVTPELDNGTQ